MKTSKKLLSFFLAVVMVITTCSVGFTAFAQDNSNSIWETSSDAEAAFNSLNGLADDYLPAVLINASPAISAPVYKKYAGEYKNADGTPKTADQLTDKDKKDIANNKATLQDVLGALQPVLLNALGTSQEDYVTAVDGEDSQKDASYYDYLIKYKLDENGDPMLDSEGNPIVDDSSISFFSLYILCRDYRFNSELSKSTRDTLSEWYETLNQIANIDSSAVVKKYADMYAPIMNPTYDYATLYELECTFTDEFWETQVSAEDKLVLEALFDSYNTQYEEYSMGIKIDSLADLIYYCYGAGQNVKYAYAYYNLVHSTGTTVTFNKTTEDVTGTFGGQITYNIDEDITPENAAILSGGSVGTHLQMGIGDGLIPENLNTTIYEHICVISDEEAIETAKRLASEEGIMCGISSGSNVAAAIKLAKRLGKGKTVVTVLPDTGERYFSTKLFED